MKKATYKFFAKLNPYGEWQYIGTKTVSSIELAKIYANASAKGWAMKWEEVEG